MLHHLGTFLTVFVLALFRLLRTGGAVAVQESSSHSMVPVNLVCRRVCVSLLKYVPNVGVDDSFSDPFSLLKLHIFQINIILPMHCTDLPLILVHRVKAFGTYLSG